MRLRAYSCGDDFESCLQQDGNGKSPVGSKVQRLVPQHSLEWIAEDYEPRKRRASVGQSPKKMVGKCFSFLPVEVPPEEELYQAGPGELRRRRSRENVGTQAQEAGGPSKPVRPKSKIVYTMDPIGETDEIFEHKDSRLAFAKKTPQDVYLNKSLAIFARKKQEFDSGEFFKDQYFAMKEESERNTESSQDIGS